MIKRILGYIQKEALSALRNNIVIYMILFPLLLSIGLKFFLPSVQSMKLTVAVDSLSEERVIGGFKKYAKVELYNGMAEIKKRVERFDDVAGIVRDGDEYVVVLEGNEGGDAEGIARALLNTILSKEPLAQYEHLSLNKDNSDMKAGAGGLLLLMSALIGGLVIGLNLVDEKEGNSIKALGVSPLRLGELIISHGILCLATSIILSMLTILIFSGTSVDYFKILISMISTAGIGMLLGYIIGIMADNLISAIAVIKILMFVFIGIPIGSLFVPGNFQWIFYPFPHYWAFQSYLGIFGGNHSGVDFDASSLIALGISILIIMILTPIAKKNLKLR